MFNLQRYKKRRGKNQILISDQFEPAHFQHFCLINDMMSSIYCNSLIVSALKWSNPRRERTRVTGKQMQKTDKEQWKRRRDTGGKWICFVWFEGRNKSRECDRLCLWLVSDNFILQEQDEKEGNSSRRRQKIEERTWLTVTHYSLIHYSSISLQNAAGDITVALKCISTTRRDTGHLGSTRVRCESSFKRIMTVRWLNVL